MIKIIIFDLSEVYLNGIMGSAKYIQEEIGTTVAEEYFYNDAFNEFILGRTVEDKYWKSIIDAHGWSISIKALKNAVRKNFLEIKGTRKIMEDLKNRGYVLALLSNHGKEWVEYCEQQYKYHNLFKHILYSYQVHLAKPDRDIFIELLKLINFRPETCLFIDDNKKNILAAEELGMKALLFTSAFALKNDFKRLKILI